MHVSDADLEDTDTPYNKGLNKMGSRAHFLTKPGIFKDHLDRHLFLTLLLLRKNRPLLGMTDSATAPTRRTEICKVRNLVRISYRPHSMRNRLIGSHKQ